MNNYNHRCTSSNVIDTLQNEYTFVQKIKQNAKSIHLVTPSIINRTIYCFEQVQNHIALLIQFPGNINNISEFIALS